MRIIKLAAAGAAAGALFLTATSAYAVGGATLKASSTTVYQGGKVYLAAKCPDAADHPLLWSRLFFGHARFGVVGRITFVQVNVSKTKKPGTYPILLGCVSKRHFDGIATASVTVLKATSKTSTSTIATSGGKPFGAASVIIDTGLGGMARFVAHHHPAR